MYFPHIILILNHITMNYMDFKLVNMPKKYFLS